MTDRELLELAAKAIGVKVVCGRAYGGIEGRLLHHMGAGLLCMNDLYWNPLADDGDSLRLAVRLRQMRVHIDAESTAAFRNDLHGIPREYAGEPHGSDPYATTRRAIVRAAAEIGRNMK